MDEPFEHGKRFEANTPMYLNEQRKPLEKAATTERTQFEEIKILRENEILVEEELRNEEHHKCSSFEEESDEEEIIAHNPATQAEQSQSRSISSWSGNRCDNLLGSSVGSVSSRSRNRSDNLLVSSVGSVSSRSGNRSDNLLVSSVRSVSSRSGNRSANVLVSSVGRVSSRSEASSDDGYSKSTRSSMHGGSDESYDRSTRSSVHGSRSEEPGKAFPSSPKRNTTPPSPGHRVIHGVPTFFHVTARFQDFEVSNLLTRGSGLYSAAIRCV